MTDSEERPGDIPESALRGRTAAYWKALLAHAADITVVLDDQARVLDATSSFQRVLGWSSELLAGRTALDLVHPDDLDRAQRLLADVRERRVLAAPFEMRAARVDGGWSWMRGTLTDLRDHPDVGGIVANLRDVTAERTRELAAKRLEAVFRARFEQSALAQVMIDMSARITLVNEAYCNLVGRRREQLVGEPVTALVHAEEPPGPSAGLTELLAGTRTNVRMERLLVRPDGTRLPVLVDASLVREDDGSPLGCAAFLQDLTELHEVQQSRTHQEATWTALQARSNDLALLTDAGGRLRFAAPALTPLLGYQQHEVLGRLATDFVHPQDLRAAQEVLSGLPEGGSRRVLVRVLAASGEWRWVEATVTPMLTKRLNGVICNVHDVHEQVEATAALRASEARYRAIVETADEGIWLLSPEGRTVFANARTAAILGRSPEELHASGMGTLLEPREAALLVARAPGSSREVERFEVDYAHPDGGPRRLKVAVSPIGQDETPSRLVVLADITEAHQNAQQLRHQALHDALTGLPNQALLIDRLEHALERETVGTAVLLLDLDRFTMVNESRGHAFGDEVLRAVAQRLAEHVPAGCTVGRFSGDEFLVLCEDIAPDEAALRAREWVEAVAEPFDVRGEVVRVSACVGVATSPPRDGGDLLRFADIALHAAKAAGAGRVNAFDPRLAAEAEQLFQLSADLRGAIAEGGLELVFQPVVDLTDGRLRGAEVLSRWSHPSRGAVPPDRFVAVAEAVGAALELDVWVLRTALPCAAAVLGSDLDRYVAVNLSASNLADPALRTAVVEATTAARLHPRQVVLEVTERAIMQDRESTVESLTALRRLGFGIAIDDFGTGYSSLAYLRDLPVTVLKIDRSFVRDIVDDEDAQAIVTSIIDLARTVGLSTVAEGVETVAQAALLRRLGCSAGQGWLWSPGVPVQEVQTSAYDVHLEAPVVAPLLRAEQQAATPEHGLERLLEMHGEGASLATIAAGLNREGFRRPGGARWHHTSVARVIADVVRARRDA